MVNLFIGASFIKKMLAFCSKDECRWAIYNCMCVRRFGTDEVEFAATDGAKLLVIRRPLANEEEIDGDTTYIVPIGNLPLKGKYLSYHLTIAGEEACFNDGENVFKFPLRGISYPNYRELFVPLLDAPKAEKFAMFKAENIKAAEQVLTGANYERPSTKDNRVFLWKNELASEKTYVVIAAIVSSN